MLTTEALKSLFSYNKETGIFTRINNSYRKNNAGETIGYKNKKGYISVEVKVKGVKQKLLAHRLAYTFTFGEIPQGMQIDHIDGDRSNNKINNLRCVTPRGNSENQKNAMPFNQTKLIGVSFYKRDNIFTAQINVNGKKKHLGRFKTAEEANIAYVKAKRVFHNTCTI